MNQTAQLEELLGQFFDELREGLRSELPPEEYDRRRHEFIFHMIDCKEDVERLADWLKHPEGPDDTAAAEMLAGFLYHVVPHMNAAARLLLDRIGDPFCDRCE
jgi:hypothetical protein